MKNLQLIELLRSLNKSEFREFGKFINSPYFNNRSEVIRFYDVIKKFYPLFDSNGLNEEKIFNSVYPGKEFSDVMMRKLVSLMTNLILDFYAEISFKDDILGYNVKLLYKLYEKNLSVMFEKKAKSIKELLQNKQIDPLIYNNYAIKVAAEKGYLEMVKILIQDGRVDPWVDKNYAIKWAAHYDHKEVVKLLIIKINIYVINDNKTMKMIREIKE